MTPNGIIGIAIALFLFSLWVTIQEYPEQGWRAWFGGFGVVIGVASLGGIFGNILGSLL